MQVKIPSFTRPLQCEVYLPATCLLLNRHRWLLRKESACPSFHGWSYTSWANISVLRFPNLVGIFYFFMSHFLFVYSNNNDFEYIRVHCMDQPLKSIIFFYILIGSRTNHVLAATLYYRSYDILLITLLLLNEYSFLLHTSLPHHKQVYVCFINTNILVFIGQCAENWCIPESFRQTIQWMKLQFLWLWYVHKEKLIHDLISNSSTSALTVFRKSVATLLFSK